MRILYLAPDPTPAPKGASVRIELTVRSLLSLGHEVRLLTPAAPAGRLEGVEHDAVELPQENYLERMLAFRREAAAWLRGRRAELVQFRGIWEGLPAAAWAAETGARAVFEPHGFPSLELPYHFPALRENEALLERLAADENRLLRAADRVLTHSRTGRRFLLARGVPPARVAVVYNAADPALFAPARASAPDGPPWRIVYAGTLAPWQGLETLLEALRLLRRRDLELLVVGPRKGPWRARLRALARRLRVQGALRLCGAVAQRDLAPILHGAHLCAAPLPADARNAVQGCCPLKVLEYMAAARPILATGVPPLRELLTHGRDAWLVEPGSASALADGLAWLLAHPDAREALGRAARGQLLARFTPELFRARLAQALAPLGEPAEVSA